MTTTAPSPAAATAVFKAMPAFAGLGIRFSVVVPASAGGGYQAYSLNLSHAAAAGLAEIAEETRRRLTSSTPIAYGPAVLIPPSHVMHVPQSTAATLDVIQATVSIADSDAFDPKASYASDVRMVAAQFSTQNGQTVTFYRIADTLLQFAKRKVFSLIRRNGQYDRLEPADVLLMRSSFDVVVIAGHAFFFLKPSFEQAFGFLDELKQASAATFDQVTADLRISGMGELKAACTSQPQMMAKMASIRRSMDEDATYASALTMDKLLTFIDANPHLGIAVEGSGSHRSLKFNPAPATRFQIVKLLDDDYLRSILTQRDYEAGSKTRA